MRLDDTNLVVSVNERSESDFIKLCEGTDITTNYIDDRDRLSSRIDKRGKSSVTQGIIIERDTEIDAEQVARGHKVWRDVYRIMYCPGPLYRYEGQYCWQDLYGKKHYKLRTNHLKMLTRYIQQGGVIETHKRHS